MAVTSQAFYAAESVTPQYIGGPGPGNDWTACFKQMIAYCANNGNPATQIIKPISQIYIPAGVYKITSDLNLLSFDGLSFIGAGSESTTLVLSGTGFTNSGIYADGMFRAKFKGFTITGDGTDAAPIALSITNSAATAGFTNGVIVEDVVVINTNCTTGIFMGDQPTYASENDTNVIRDCLIQGANGLVPLAGAQGIVLGNTVAGNQYDYTLENVELQGWATGLQALNTGFWYRGGTCVANGSDFNVQPFTSTTIEGIQSQVSSRFISSVTGGTFMGQVSLRDITFKPGTAIASDGKWIDMQAQSLSFLAENVYCLSAGASPVVYLASGAGIIAATLINLAQNSALAGGVVIADGSRGSLALLSYVQLNSSGQISAITASQFTNPA